MARICLPDNPVQRLLAKIQDLEERYQKAVRNQNSGKAMPLAIMHDLRTPMTVVSSDSQSYPEGRGLLSSAPKNLRIPWAKGNNPIPIPEKH